VRDAAYGKQHPKSGIRLPPAPSKVTKRRNMLSKQDLNNIAVFLQRCSLQGNESTVHAMLLQRVGQEIQAMDSAEKLDKKIDEKQTNKTS